MITNFIHNFGAACDSTFFGLKSWHHYLKKNGSCEIVDFQVLPKSGKSDFLLIALALIDDLLRIAGLIAIGFVIYGAVLYMISQGEPDKTKKAFGTIINALVGLVLCILSVALVAFFGSRIG